MSSPILPALFSSATGGTLWAAVSVIAEKEELSKNHNSHWSPRINVTNLPEVAVAGVEI